MAVTRLKTPQEEVVQRTKSWTMRIPKAWATRTSIRSLALVLVLIGVVIASERPGLAADQPAPRRATQQYMSPAVAAMPYHPYGAAICNREGAVGGNRGCVVFPVKVQERFLDVSVVDATGLPVPAFVAQSDDPSEWVPFCGETARPLPIIRGVEVTVILMPYRAVNLPLCVGSATSGRVTATFRSRR